jgi:predicted O-methyltransferase YrrM
LKVVSKVESLQSNMLYPKVKKALQDLCDNNILPFPEEEEMNKYLGYFPTFREAVREAFYIPQSSITKAMAQLLFIISCIKRPRRVLVLGSFAGNAMVWIAGPVCQKLYYPDFVLGVDIDPEAIRISKTNFMALKAPDYIKSIHEDGHKVIDVLDTSYDLVYIDVEYRDRKDIYLSLLEKLQPKLEKDALVLAHDIDVPKFKDDLVPYFNYVKNTNHFENTISLHIDYCGLEVTRR